MNNLDPFEYHGLRYGGNFSKEMERNLIHTYHQDEDEDQDPDQDVDGEICRTQRELERWGAQ